jgi:hypothetical protein
VRAQRWAIVKQQLDVIDHEASATVGNKHKIGPATSTTSAAAL